MQSPLGRTGLELWNQTRFCRPSPSPRNNKNEAPSFEVPALVEDELET